jgi:mannosyltransferase
MAAAGGLVGLLGRRLAGDARAGLVAGLLFALVPTTARYGQEARPYAFAVLAALLATWTLLRALERPCRRRWLLYAAAVACVGWAHLVALGVLAAHLVLALRADRLRAWATALGCGLIPVAPFALMARGQAEQIAWITTDGADIAAMPYMLLRSPAATALVFGLAAVALVAAAARRPGRADGPPLAPLAVWALVPLLLTLVSAHWLHFFLDRYLLFTVPAWLLLAVVGLGRLRLPAAGYRAAAAVALSLIAVLAPWERDFLSRNTPAEPDYHAVAGAVLAGQLPGDGIAYTHRLRPRRALEYELRDSARPADVFLYRPAERLGSYEADECPDASRCAADYDRIWLVAAGAGADPFAGMPPGKAAVLTTEFRMVRGERFPNVQLLLLERPAR